eukprot:TRINITY_DN977_c0_g1_i2.p2 TRINITY_DN977_c0_g1~~TRINITY_DN977_c0_g1_i2.p2  ORF type:complete len:237 (+),score=35.66 TRINITY_DN977_c0_g1_i2:679-1389(+)
MKQNVPSSPVLFAHNSPESSSRASHCLRFWSHFLRSRPSLLLHKCEAGPQFSPTSIPAASEDEFAAPLPTEGVNPTEDSPAPPTAPVIEKDPPLPPEPLPLEAAPNEPSVLPESGSKTAIPTPVSSTPPETASTNSKKAPPTSTSSKTSSTYSKTAPPASSTSKTTSTNSNMKQITPPHYPNPATPKPSRTSAAEQTAALEKSKRTTTSTPHLSNRGLRSSKEPVLGDESFSPPHK